MEIELGNVQAHTSERLESYQRSDRENKELTFQIEEDEKKTTDNGRIWRRARKEPSWLKIRSCSSILKSHLNSTIKVSIQKQKEQC